MIQTATMLLAIMFTQATSAQPVTTPREMGGVVEIAGPVLMVGDLERSLKFYVDGLGMVLGSRLSGNPGPGATVIARAGSPAPFLLLRQQGKTAVTSSIQHGNGLSRVMLLVSDSQAAAGRLDRAGYPHGPVSKNGIFFVSDPDGYRFEIMQRNSGH